MGQQESQDVLHIKKYPNRRYYDTTRSRHITLQEVHDLILEGRDVQVIDSKSGSDITNVVLLQILLEKDHPKLDVFPSSVLHMMVRANHQALRASVDAIFGPFLDVMSQSQRQIDQYWRNAIQGRMVNPMDWADSMMRAFSPNAVHHGSGEGAVPSDDDYSPPDEAAPDEAAPDEAAPDEAAPDEAAPDESESLSDLRRQVAELKQRLEDLSASGRAEDGAS